MKFSNDVNYKKRRYLIKVFKCSLDVFKEIIPKLLLSIYFICQQITHQIWTDVIHFSCVFIADFKHVNVTLKSWFAPWKNCITDEFLKDWNFRSSLVLKIEHINFYRKLLERNLLVQDFAIAQTIL